MAVLIKFFRTELNFPDLAVDIQNEISYIENISRLANGMADPSSNEVANLTCRKMQPFADGS